MLQSKKQKTPIILCLMNSVSGVTSWGLTLKKAFKEHPKYELFLMNLWHEQKSDEFDFNPVDLEEAQAIFEQFAPAIIIPNYNWQVLYGITNQSLGFIGVCHSDSEKEYYLPLVKHQGDFAKFISVSQTCTNNLGKRLPNRTDDMMTLPGCIEVPEVLVERTYQTEPIRIIYGGRIVQEQKRVFDLIKLVQYLDAKKVDYILNIVGEGADCEKLKEKMSAETNSEHVHFWGRKSPKEMIDIWANHDVFLQLSDYEGTSASMLEAMAQGTIPVVTAASSGVTEVIDHSKNGYIVPVGDMQEMANIIKSLMTKPKSIPAMGQAAYERSKAYDVEPYIASLTKFLDPVASKLASSQDRWGRYEYWQNKLLESDNRATTFQARVEKLEFDLAVQDADYKYQLSQQRVFIAKMQANQTEMEIKFAEQQQQAKTALDEAEKRLEAEIVEIKRESSALVAKANDLTHQSDMAFQALNQQVSDQKTFIQQIEQQRSTTSQTLKKQLKSEKHKAHTMHEQIKQKDVHINWLEQERNRLNNSLSLRIGRIFYPIKSFFARLVGRSTE